MHRGKHPRLEGASQHGRATGMAMGTSSLPSAQRVISSEVVVRWAGFAAGGTCKCVLVGSVGSAVSRMPSSNAVRDDEAAVPTADDRLGRPRCMGSARLADGPESSCEAADPEEHTLAGFPCGETWPLRPRPIRAARRSAAEFDRRALTRPEGGGPSHHCPRRGRDGGARRSVGTRPASDGWDVEVGPDQTEEVAPRSGARAPCDAPLRAPLRAPQEECAGQVMAAVAPGPRWPASDWGGGAGSGRARPSSDARAGPGLGTGD
jgi:hypothetical protein